MKYKEFLEYLESNLDGYQAFMRKARQFQDAQNAKRQKNSRWTDEKLDKAAYGMWKKSMETLYNNLKNEIKSELPSAWTNFIEKNGILETVNEGISDMDFTGDAV